MNADRAALKPTVAGAPERPDPGQGGPGFIAIDVTIESEAWQAVDDIEALIHAAVEAALTESGERLDDEAELSVVLCDDAFIADLNKTWRGIDKPTNVLSFPVDQHSTVLGDIVVAFETVAREALEEHKALRDHLTHMIVHGFLHLLGFDHEEDADAETMEAIENRTLTSLGLAAPFQNDGLPIPDHRFPDEQAAKDSRTTR